MSKRALPEFQKYLLSRDIVEEKNVQFYAYWASKFLSFSNTSENLTHDLRIKKFLNNLKTQKNTPDWQIRQADEAIKLYIDNFLKGDTSTLYPNEQHPEKEPPDISKILSELREAIRVKHYSYRTEQIYIGWVKRFYEHTLNLKKENISENGFASDDIRDYLSYLALKRRVSASTQNQAFNALLFLFRNVLQIELGDLGKTVRAKQGQRLPVVLSREEVQALFKHAEGLNLLILQLLYGAGVRLMEFARLRVKDVDFSSSLLFVRDGKGDNDRSTILPEVVKKELRLHLEKVKTLHEKDLALGYGEVYLPDVLERKYPKAAKERHWQYVFPSSKLSVDPRSGKVRRHHMSEKTVQRVAKNAVKQAGIYKHVTVHTLRHSFATHLLMNGVNIREIQTLLGHKNVETTMIYTHVLRDISNAPRSPLDDLFKNE